MTNEERDLIARFISRVGGSPQQGGFLPGSGSVPQTQTPLPPVDREADAFINQQFQQYPEARYRITQMALVQEAALAEMTNRVNRLQWELEQTRNAAQQAQQQPQQSRGGFLSGLFGGGASSAPQPQRGGPWGGGGGQFGPQYQPTSAPPPPQYPPNYQPGMFQRGGSGFLGSALTTAAGVAGGMVVGNALMNAFSGHHGDAGGLLGGGQTASGSAFDSAGTAFPVNDPTTGFTSDTGVGGGGDPFASGGADKGFDDGGGFSQNTGFDQGGGGDPFGGGGFDNAGGGGFDAGGGGDPFGGGGFDSGSSDT